MSKDQVPVKWDEELAKHAKAAAAVERPQVSRISIRGGVMTLLDQRVPGNKLEGVVLASIVEQAYYSKPFDAQNPDAPDCFAFSETGGDMVPHEKAFAKQHETCAGCPQNEWGSATRSPSGRGKACKQRRKIIIMPASVLKDGNIAKAELALMDIPVTSVKFWSNYVNRIAAQENRPPWAVVTAIIVEPDPKTQLRVSFDCSGVIDAKHLSDIMKRLESAKEILSTPYEKAEKGLSPKTEAMQTGKKY